MKNVTITLDEKTAAWVRIYAAQKNLSVSRLVGELLSSHMQEVREYEGAMRRFLAKAPVPLSRSSKKYPSRDELHDRPGLR